MGAGASLELQEEARKPIDGSDLRGSSLDKYKMELGALREKLMVYVEDKTQWPLDLSDICIGDEDEDIEACHQEICYLRNALQLQTKTSSSRRRNKDYEARRNSVASSEQTSDSEEQVDLYESKRKK